MQLNIPEGAQVQIIIGEQRPILALSDETRATPARPLRRRRPLLLAAMAGALLFGAFQVGRHAGAGTATVQAEMQPAMPSVAAQRGRPDSPLSGGGPGAGAQLAGDPTQVPPSFAQQLRQPPIVSPPPGQTTAGSETNAFGLHQ